MLTPEEIKWLNAYHKEVHDKQAALEAMAERDEKMNKGLFVGCKYYFLFFSNTYH